MNDDPQSKTQSSTTAWHNRMDHIGKYGTAMTERYLHERRIRAIKTFHRQAWLNKQKNATE